jgi:hypothetical protein
MGRVRHNNKLDTLLFIVGMIGSKLEARIASLQVSGGISPEDEAVNTRWKTSDHDSERRMTRSLH